MRITYIIGVVVLMCVLVCPAVFGQAGQDMWRMYRQNSERTGVVLKGAGGVMQSYRPMPIWIFPPADEYQPIDNQDAEFAIVSGTWNLEDETKAANTAVGCYGEDYVVADTDSGGSAVAEFTYDFASLSSETASFYAYAWWPSPGAGEPLPHTTDAHYYVIVRHSSGVDTVYGRGLDANGVMQPYLLDQTSGGAWIIIGGNSFPVAKGDKLIIRVTSKSEAKDEDGNLIASRVFADAVKIERATGVVVASPAVAEENPVVVTCVSEPDANGAQGATSQGVIYGLGTEHDIPGVGTAADDDRGKMVWRYPPLWDRDWIGGGLSCSPAIAGTGAGNEIAVVPGYDGQVYAVHTSDGSLVWQGPGYIIDDGGAVGSTFLSGGWSAGAGAGFMGAGYSDSQAVPDGTTNPDTCTWSVNIPSSSVDRYYDIFAWIPPLGTHPFVSDAKYCELDGAGAVISGTTRRVSQKAYGTWVLIADKFYVAPGTTSIRVQLTNESNTTAAEWVAADAIKVIPYGLTRYDFGSPAIDDSGSNIYAYVGSSCLASGKLAGKMCKLKLDPATSRACEPEWIYPQGSSVIGAIYGSPALVGDTLYFGTANGQVYALDATDGSVIWQYPGTGANKALPEITSTTAVATIGGDKLIYVGLGGSGTTYQDQNMIGRILCLKESPGASGPQVTVQWIYPDPTGGHVGAFTCASPLVMDRTVGGGGNPIVVLPSTDTTMYAVDAAGNPTTQLTTEVWKYSLGGKAFSSPAGTFADYPDVNNVARTGNPVPMLYVGGGTRLHGVEMNAPSADWWWDLLGEVWASPAVVKGRIYAADTKGYTWAFSSRPNAAGTGAEDWNTDLGPGPPTQGSNSSGSGIQAAPKIDVFDKAGWEKLKEEMETAERNPADNTKWMPLDRIHQYCLGHDGTDTHDSRKENYTLEWGEDLYIMVYDLVDPNQSDSVPTKWRRPQDTDTAMDPKFTDNYPGKVQISIVNKGSATDPGTTETVTLSGRSIDVFTCKDVNIRARDAGLSNIDGWACFYAQYVYTLDGSSQSKMQTPGSSITISAVEQPISPPNSSSLPVYVTSANQKTTNFTINNPLGLFSDSPYGTATSNPVWIGVDSSSKDTKRTMVDAQINGNPAGVLPMIWGGYTPHNKLSDSRTVTIFDRSLLGANGRKISRFKIHRNDLEWTYPAGQPPINFIAQWEQPPAGPLSGNPNVSQDYPDIQMRQVRSRMQANGLDPAQGPVELRPTVSPMPANPDESWAPMPNNVNLAVFVPQYQPPNLPASPATASAAQLDVTGYGSKVYAYVDSNNNGSFDKPSAVGLAAAQQQRTGSGLGEAYREFAMRVHVPADYRAEIEEQRLNVGSVPQGFGYTGGSGVPQVFIPDLVYDPLVGVGGTLSPPLFQNWFKTFTARNIGNVNLLNVGIYRPGAWWYDLVSDTVSPPEVDPNTGTWKPFSGYVIPYADVASTLDPVTGFVSKIPPVVTPALPDIGYRTFHKPRVGEQPPTLLLPDYPTWYAGPASYKPAVSVAVPLGTPVGTYYGKVQLAEKGVPISNQVGLVVNVTEAKLTNGAVATEFDSSPHLLHLDPPPDPSKKEYPTADGMPAAYRNPSTGNIELFWASSRYGARTRGGVDEPAPNDPWYLYQSILTRQAGGSYWQLASQTQWWSPTTTSSMIPPPNALDVFFPGPAPAANDPTRGATGAILPSTVKFGNPSVTMDKSTGDAWLFFTGQATKDNGNPHLPTERRRQTEYRAYYTKLTGGEIDPAKIYSPSEWSAGITDNPQVRGDWTTPKFGVRGAPMLWRNAAGDVMSPLWSFWYGGISGKWKIYYNADPSPNNRTLWTNEATLPVSKGLSSASEPSPIMRWGFGFQVPYIPNQLCTGNRFDVVYSGVSAFHGNSDIYMSRYEADDSPDTAAKGGSWPVHMKALPQRAKYLDPADITLGGDPFFGEKLTRDATKGVWYSRDLDWLATVVSAKDAKPAKPVSFAVYVRLGSESPDVPHQLNIGSYTKDPATGAIVYTYDDNTPECQFLRATFRAVVINPTDGTVRFQKPPTDKSTVVAAQYYPQAYRLTTDSVTDAAPYAVWDDDPNWRYDATKTSGLPFYTKPSNLIPPTDRLWVFWRRPSMDKPGTGIYYKTYRYAVQLDHQIGLEQDVVNQQVVYNPLVQDILPGDPDIGCKPIAFPVEVDWTTNRLYFSHIDSIFIRESSKLPELKPVEVIFTDAQGNTVRESHHIELVEEDFGQSGKTFGNLTSAMVNEGQVSAFKDPFENKMWVFWTSTRSGNADVYYETISPRFHGREMK